jgi:hypothetical protein
MSKPYITVVQLIEHLESEIAVHEGVRVPFAPSFTFAHYFIKSDRHTTMFYENTSPERPANCICLEQGKECAAKELLANLLAMDSSSPESLDMVVLTKPLPNIERFYRFFTPEMSPILTFNKNTVMFEDTDLNPLNAVMEGLSEIRKSCIKDSLMIDVMISQLKAYKPSVVLLDDTVMIHRNFANRYPKYELKFPDRFLEPNPGFDLWVVPHKQKDLDDFFGPNVSLMSLFKKFVVK